MATRDEILRFLIETKGDDALKRVATEMDKLAKSGGAAESDISEFVDELDKLAKIDRSITALTKLKAGLAETGTSLDKAKTRVAELEKQLSTAGTPTAKLAKDLDRARTAVDNLTKEQNRQRSALDQNSNSLKKAGVDTERLGSAQRQVRQDITSLTDRFWQYASRVREAGANNERLAKSTRDLGTASKGAKNDLAGVELGLGKIAAAAGAALAALKGIQFGANLVGDAAALEQSLAQVQAVSGATAEDFGRLRKAAEDAAASTGISIGAVTEGLAELARTGLDANGVIATLRPTLDLAQAGNIALAQAVEITATTLTQFGLGADQAGRVADVLAQTANATQSSVEGLGRSLTDVAPLAKQLNIPLEETVAILGKLSDEGFKGSRAGTSLRAAFTQLLDPSTKFREELSKLGITSTDFTTVLEELATKGDAGRNAILALGQEAAPAILALAGKGGGAIRALTADLANAGGAAEQVAATIRDTLGNAFDRLSNTAGNAITQLIDPLLKPLQGLLEDVAARLADFAASEDFTKIRDGLEIAFKEGIGLAGELIESTDFSDLSERVQEFASVAGERFAELRGGVNSLVAGFEAISAAIRVLGNAAQAGLGFLESRLLSAKSLLLEIELQAAKIKAPFTESWEEVARIEQELRDVERAQDDLLAAGQRDWQELKEAASDFGDAVGRVGGELDNLTGRGESLGALAGAFDAVVEGIKRTAEEARAATAEIGDLAVETTQAAAEMEPAANRAAKSIELTGDAAVRARQAIVKNFEQARQELEAKANEIAISIARGLETGADTSALQAELQQVQNQITETDRKLAQARAQFGAVGEEGERAGQRIASSFAGAAGQIGQTQAAMVSLDQAASQSFGNIGNKTSQVTGGPLAALNKAFEEARNSVKALGSESLEAFDRALQVGERIKVSGLGLTNTMDLLARRTQEAIDFAKELERTQAATRDRVRETVQAATELSRIQSLSLEQQRQANLEAEQALLETTEKRAKAAESAAAAVEGQVAATRTLAALQEGAPPQRIELTAANKQKPGEILGELSDSDLLRLAQQVVSIIGQQGRGVFGA